MTIAVALLTRDLRLSDNPVLATAVDEFERVVPLFVLDDALLARSRQAANRLAFLLESLGDLRLSLRRAGGSLIVRRGSTVVETLRTTRATGATAILAAEDAGPFAARREAELAAACRAERLELRLLPGVAIVPAGDIVPAGRDHFSVFTPYFRRWEQAPLRALLRPPGNVAVHADMPEGTLPELQDLTPAAPSPARTPGGESAGRARLERWLQDGMTRYDQARDDLAADATSRLSAYLHFGCLSPLEVVTRARAAVGSATFVRQLCWRDFFHQLLAARPKSASEDLRSGRRAWLDPAQALDAWREGRTGYPLVDAGMRQLRAEGFMHNRARLVVSSFLTKTLGIDWRHGAAHFARLLTDAEHREQHRQLAVGGGNRRRHPARQDPQPPSPGVPVRPARRVRAPVRRGARGRPRVGGTRAMVARRP